MISIHIKFTHSLLIENHHRTTQLIKPRYRKIKMWSDLSVVRWSRTVRCLWSWGFCVVTETIQSSGDQLNLRGRAAHSASKPQIQGFVISAVAGFFWTSQSFSSCKGQNLLLFIRPAPCTPRSDSLSVSIWTYGGELYSSPRPSSLLSLTVAHFCPSLLSPEVAH